MDGIEEANVEESSELALREPTEVEDPEGEYTLKDMSVLNLKRDIRRELHYYLWLRNKSYETIAGMTGFTRQTIWYDIKYVREHWEIASRDMDKIRDEALMRLHLDRVEIFKVIEQAKRAEKPNYGNIAKLFGEITKIDTMILSRYTQMDSKVGDPLLEEKMKILMDYMIEKIGPESLADFDEYYKTALAAKEIGKHIKK